MGPRDRQLGHQVKLIAPKYVKPFVKRQKNDAADAEAICEAAMRPTMRFVAVKSETVQASALVFRTRDILVRQRTQRKRCERILPYRGLTLFLNGPGSSSPRRDLGCPFVNASSVSVR